MPPTTTAPPAANFIDKLDGSGTIWASPDANRDVVIDYIRKNPAVTRGQQQRQELALCQGEVAGPVVFSSAPGALSVAQAAGLKNVSLLAADDGTGGASKVRHRPFAIRPGPRSTTSSKASVHGLLLI